MGANHSRHRIKLQVGSDELKKRVGDCVDEVEIMWSSGWSPSTRLVVF